MKLTKFNQLLEDDEILKGTRSLDDNHELQYKKDGQGFIRLSKILEESRVETGMRFTW